MIVVYLVSVRTALISQNKGMHICYLNNQEVPYVSW